MTTSPKCIVALDLDGTSVRYEPRLEMEPAVVDMLRALKQHGVAWVMNSDRYVDDMVDIARLLDADDRPAAILSCQRFICRHDGNGGYRACSAWNAEQMRLHKELWDTLSPNFPAWKDEICRRFTVLQAVANDLVFACLVPPEQTDALRALLRELTTPWAQAQLSGNHEWSFVLHAAFSKGRLLKKCAELMGIGHGRIIAVGDGINDISMLDGSVTPHVGCPANASPEVIEAVAAAGGLVAGHASGAGTIQIVRHYCERLLGCA